MSEGLNQDNIKRYLSDFTNNVNESNYVYCLIKPCSFIAFFTNILRFGQPAIMYFSEKEVVFLYLTKLGKYTGDNKIIPYDDINYFNHASFAFRYMMVMKCDFNESLDITIPKVLLGGGWQPDNLNNLLNNSFYKKSWYRNNS